MRSMELHYFDVRQAGASSIFFEAVIVLDYQFL
jgi:hypothetical protein